MNIEFFWIQRCEEGNNDHFKKKKKKETGGQWERGDERINSGGIL